MLYLKEEALEREIIMCKLEVHLLCDIIILSVAFMVKFYVSTSEDKCINRRCACNRDYASNRDLIRCGLLAHMYIVRIDIHIHMHYRRN